MRKTRIYEDLKRVHTSASAPADEAKPSRPEKKWQPTKFGKSIAAEPLLNQEQIDAIATKALTKGIDRRRDIAHEKAMRENKHLVAEETRVRREQIDKKNADPKNQINNPAVREDGEVAGQTQSGEMTDRKSLILAKIFERGRQIREASNGKSRSRDSGGGRGR